MKKIVVNDNKFNGKLLSDFLFFNFEGLSKNTFFKALRKKDIRINDVKINENQKIFLGDAITIYIADEFLFKKQDIKKIYEDENILIINKSNNLEVTGHNSLTSLLKKEYTYIVPCHRLDRNTTGLVLFAKNQVALDILLKKFKNHEIEKHYLAKVYKIADFDSHYMVKNNNMHDINKKSNSSNNVILRKGYIQNLVAYLFKDNKKSLVYISDIPKKGYVKIETSITLLEENKKENYYLLDVELHTGKTHQIRAHLAHIGLPIIGDGKYGINEINKKFGVKTQELHSYKLKFNFKTDAGILNYLKGKEVKQVDCPIVP